MKRKVKLMYTDMTFDQQRMIQKHSQRDQIFVTILTHGNFKKIALQPIYTSPQSVITTGAFGFPESVPDPSIFFTRSIPEVTSPNTTWRSSSQGQSTVVMKN